MSKDQHFTISAKKLPTSMASQVLTDISHHFVCLLFPLPNTKIFFSTLEAKQSRSLPFGCHTSLITLIEGYAIKVTVQR